MNCSLASFESEYFMEKFLVTLDAIQDAPPTTTDRGSSKMVPLWPVGLTEGYTIPIVTRPNALTSQGQGAGNGAFARKNGCIFFLRQ